MCYECSTGRRAEPFSTSNGTRPLTKPTIAIVAVASAIALSEHAVWAIGKSTRPALTARGQFRQLFKQNPKLRDVVYRDVRAKLRVSRTRAAAVSICAAFFAGYGVVGFSGDPINALIGGIMTGPIAAWGTYDLFRGERLAREVTIEVARQAGMAIGPKAERRLGALKVQNRRVEAYLEQMHQGPLPPFPPRNR